MEFNKYWTKKDNDKLRQMIKENKSVDEIRNYFGNDKLFYHPSKKYYIPPNTGTIPSFKNKIEDFTGFITEIKYNELKTDFIHDFKKSKQFPNEFDYIYKFQTNSGNKYVVDFIYLKDTIGPYSNTDIYNLSFTLEENHNLSNHKDYEKLTMIKEHHELMKRLIFIIKDFYNRFGNNCIFLIGETTDKRKINWYRNLIKDSFNNVVETEGVSSYTNGMKAYYYEI